MQWSVRKRFSSDLQFDFNWTWSKSIDHTLQIRGEAFNVSNTARFDPQSVQIQIDTPATFGNYTGVLGNPRVIQFTARYEF